MKKTNERGVGYRMARPAAEEAAVQVSASP